MTQHSADLQMLLVMIGAVALGAALCAAALLVLRGRFGTPRRRVVFDLTERVVPRDVPRDAVLHQSARCFGHSADAPQVRGTGVLWLTDEALGFTVREPRREVHVDLRDVVSVSARSTVRRPGVRALRSTGRPFLVIEWATEGEVPAMVSFRLDPEVGAHREQRWVDAVEDARVLRRVRSGATPRPT